MAKTSVFGPAWRERMEEARQAFAHCAEVDQRARDVMEHTKSVDATTRALDDMSQAATSAHQIWVEANPIRWARTHSTPPLSVPVLAPMAQLSTPSLFSWEHGGVSNPDASAMQNLERILSEPRLGDYWREWREIPTVFGYAK